MARVTIERIDYIDKYDLIILASRRARKLVQGAPSLIPSFANPFTHDSYSNTKKDGNYVDVAQKDNEVVTALRELEMRIIDADVIKEDIISSMQKENKAEPQYDPESFQENERPAPRRSMSLDEHIDLTGEAISEYEDDGDEDLLNDVDSETLFPEME